MYKLCDSNIKSTLRMVSVLTNVSVPKKKKKSSNLLTGSGNESHKMNSDKNTTDMGFEMLSQKFRKFH